LEEVTGILEEVHHVFFHKFIEYGSTELFAKHVIMPQSNKEALCQNMMQQALLAVLDQWMLLMSCVTGFFTA